jgi:U3 small nucleolar RNA-associated protein MPP10
MKREADQRMAGNGSTTSSMTSTSHTLTAAPGLDFLSALTDPSVAAKMAALFEAIRPGNRHEFLQPTSAIPNASLQLAQSTLDAYAGKISDEQQKRLKESNKKRKRTEAGSRLGDVLKIRKLYVDGFESGQIWQQARRIISSALEDSKEALDELKESNQVGMNGLTGDQSPLESDEDRLDIPSDQEEEEGEEDEEEGFSSEDASDLGKGAGEDEVEPDDDLEDADEDIPLGSEDDGESDVDKSSDQEEEPQEFVEDPNQLNDGFFDIDSFNKQTQWFEDQDARADPNTDAASDDEGINWYGNPLAVEPVTNGKITKNTNGKVNDESPSDMGEDDDVDEDGPTFGDMDLDAPEGDSDNEEDDGLEDAVGEESNANEVFYKDFFAPPPRKSKNGKPRKLKAPRREEPSENDVERAITDVRRDLFEDESDHDDSEDALSDVSVGDPKARRSAHERRQAKLLEAIRKLEAENVSQKKWTLSGEAKAADRPHHSLLEEDLDFEHAGKAVPVITAEVSESIEDLIKRRILAQDFDEVIRRRPDALDEASGARRGLVELDDTKAKQSLADMYEEEHVKNANPDTYVSKSDEKLRKEEQEIEQMWKDLSGKLDALSSWHYKPKPTAPSMTVVADVATVSMEDAQPATAQGVSGGDHTLAPQEIYKAGKDSAEKGEVVAKDGLPVAKQELSREEKTRRRRREKERIRKAGGIPGKQLSGKAQARKETVSDLKKAGVKVINKKGEVLDMEGNKAKTGTAASSRSFKL